MNRKMGAILIAIVFVSLPFGLFQNCGGSGSIEGTVGLPEATPADQQTQGILVEYGEIPDEPLRLEGEEERSINSNADQSDVEPVDQEDSQSLVTSACEVFGSPQHESVGNFFAEKFSALENNCLNLNVKQEKALVLAYQFANALFDQFVSETETCQRLALRASRQIRNFVLREERIKAGDEIADLLTLRNQVTKSRIDRKLRKLHIEACIQAPINEMTFTYNQVDYLFKVDANHIVNGSFELFKNPEEGSSGLDVLKEKDGWTIVEGSNVPGWRVREVNSVLDAINCNYLEIQKSGTVVVAPEGNQLVELDGHCKNAHGREARGDASTEIFQKFPVTQTGFFSLKLMAQKRNGRFGDLQTAVYQSSEQNQYVSANLPNQRSFTEVCHEIEVTDTSKMVSVSIRDAGGDNSPTLGTLVDHVRFEAGRCP